MQCIQNLAELDTNTGHASCQAGGENASGFAFSDTSCVLSNDQKTIKDQSQVFSHSVNRQGNPYSLEIMQANLSTHAATGGCSRSGQGIWLNVQPCPTA